MTETTASKKRSQSVASAIFDPKQGTFLGRTAGSWAKILVFYFFYYSFLALLFFGCIKLIGWRIEGANEGEFPMINSRLDEPGLTVYPHNTIIGDENNEQLDYTYGSMNKVKSPTADQTSMKEENDFIVSQYERRIINPALAKCSKKDPIAKSAKKMKALISKNLEKGTPIVALKINRVHRWTPVTVRSASESLKAALDANKARFQKNVVYFTCEETKAKYGEADKVNLKHVEFYNPVGSKKSCGLGAKTKNLGCIPASYYFENAKSSNPRFTGHNPFTVEPVENAPAREWGDSYTPGCWPFAYASVVSVDKSLPVAVKCQIHLENVNSVLDNPANYGWVKFGFQGKDLNQK